MQALLLAVTMAAQVMAPLHHFMDSLDRGNANAALTACASPAAIIDEFPPHEWQGKNACADWARAFETFAKQNAITATFVTLGKPLHVDVTGDRAYVVVPATYAYKDHGKSTSESALWTVALVKTADGWRMTGWAWARR